VVALYGTLRPGSHGSNGTQALEYASGVPLATDFKRIVDELPRDWTDLELDLRIADETRYVEAAVILSQCNAQGYSHHDWHWLLRCAHEFGHAAAAQTVHGVLSQLDSAGIGGELAVRQVREGRVEIVPMWGRSESVRREFAQRRAQ
jgi:hypothetical protein